MYYLYHIPGQKIGVTRNLNNRVTDQQGYSPGEYEVLDQSEDIDYISNREIELQQSYGYKKDRKLYKDLFNKIKFNMKVNATEQTTTFPVRLTELKEMLLENVGLKWETPNGYSFKLEKKMIPWIAENARNSMYTDDRSYIYNKAFHEAFFNQEETVQGGLTNFFPLIREWAQVRGIYHDGNPHTQYVKLMEEAGELASALLCDDIELVEDAIGDMVVVLTNLAELKDLKIERCIETAYNQIKDRKGSMINGTFVKQL